MGYYKDRWNKQPPWIRIPVYTVLGVIATVGFGLLFGMIIVWLWNWLMPAIFGLPTIRFWQGVGLFILARLLIGGFGNSHNESSKSHKDDKTKRTWSCEYGSDRPYHRPPFGCPPNHEPPEHGPGPMGDRPPMDHDPMDRRPPRPDFQGWRYYDEWWRSEGKQSFDTYVEQMRPTPDQPPEPSEEPSKEPPTEE
ncbi:MAG TPA: hypothetical protein PK537_06210 [Candidatus Limiplasma sp.]|nr:hypothetical protein [Candidatus Limiplasma sp.]